MNIIYKLLKQDKNTREGVVVATSVLGVLVNICLGLSKIVIGVLVSSIAVISEGINNASDSATSFLTIVGTKLAGKQPDAEHPFGYGRVEYLTSLIISILILITGLELLKSSVEAIIHPVELSVSYVTLALIAVSALIKLALGSYTQKQGERVESNTLIALGMDSKGDSIISVVTIASALVYLLFKLNIDGFAGIFTSLFILKAGFVIIKDTLSDILGRAGEKELAASIYDIIRNEPIIINAADMMLHNYGPDRYSGSVNVEIDHSKTVGEIYAAIHKLQLKIMHEHNIVMVFGIYAVDHDHDIMQQMHKDIAAFVESHQHIVSYHALYVDPDNNDIYCDLVVDYKLEDWAELRKEFNEYIAAKYPARRLELVIETEYV